MKISITFLITSICCSVYVHGQPPTINELDVPTSPGFVLLDKSPASIERPTNPKALGINLLNLLRQNDGAIDVTPYWLWNHPKHTFTQSIQNPVPFFETLNISAAGSKSDTGSYLSAGARAHIFRWYANPTRAQIEAKRLEIVAALSPTPDSNGDVHFDEPLLKRLGKEMSALRSMSAVDIELAAATAGFSTDNRFASLSDRRYGAWLNFKWQPSYKVPLSLVGVARISQATDALKTVNKDSTLLDFGLGVSYQTDNFDLQLEYVKRSDITNELTYERTTLIANYMVSDNLVVVASLGKNFDNVQNVLAVFGVKFGLSRQKVN